MEISNSLRLQCVERSETCSLRFYSFHDKVFKRCASTALLLCAGDQRHLRTRLSTDIVLLLPVFERQESCTQNVYDVIPEISPVLKRIWDQPVDRYLSKPYDFCNRDALAAD